MNEMNQAFNQLSEEIYPNKKHFVMINVLISQFYDGIQLYSTRTVNFWPLLITILNLPPSIRNKIGVGMFLLTMYSSQCGSRVERFLFEKCFVEELQLLYQGIAIHCRNKTFFLQVRLIQHCLDTKGLGKVLKVYEVNSCHGCPFCILGTGVKRKLINTVVYPGHRISLPIKHILRYYGKSQVCCPPFYYVKDKAYLNSNAEILKNSNHKFHRQVQQIKNKKESESVLYEAERLLPRFSGSCEIYSEEYNENAKLIRDFLTNDEESYTWYHECVKSFDFGDYLQFVHCDLRQPILIERKSNQQYLTDGGEANRLNEGRKTIKKHVVNGVKGLWEFYKLNYVDVKSDICFDPFHVMMDIAKHLLQLLKTVISSKVQTFCLQNCIHPYLWAADAGAPPYNIHLQTSQMEVEAWMNSILIPITYSNNFQIKSIMSETGFLKGNGAITLFSSSINFFNLSLSSMIADEYKAYFSMLGSDFNELLAYSISNKDIDYLEKQIIESVCIHEAMFTEAESTFMMHEYTHISSHIKQMGPIRGWWTYAGERAMSFVKQHISKGGQSFDKTALRRYNSCECSITKRFYRQSLLAKKDLCLYYDKDNDKLVYDNYQCKLLNLSKQHKPFEFTNFEMESLLYCLVSEVYKHFDNEIDALNNSSFFKLHYNYLKLKSKKKDYVSFYKWLSILYNFIFFKQIYPTTNEFDSSILDQIDLSDKEKETIKSLIKMPKIMLIYKNAIVFGERFTGRGINFRESRAPTIDDAYGRVNKTYMPNNLENQLSRFENWKNKKQYSSWCKFQCWNNIKQNFSNRSLKFSNPYGKSYGYGQLNFFFRVQCPSDKVIHGLPLASIVSRTFQTIEKVDKIDCTQFGSISKHNCNEIFIPITNIYASPILIAAFDEQNKPIIVTNKKFKKKTISFCSKSSIINHAYLFDLFPYKTKLLFFDRDSNSYYNTFEKL